MKGKTTLIISKEIRDQLNSIRGEFTFDQTIQYLLKNWNTKVTKNSFSCNHQPKLKRLTFDGGIQGYYTLELCPSCYEKQSKRFLVNEEPLN